MHSPDSFGRLLLQNNAHWNSNFSSSVQRFHYRHTHHCGHGSYNLNKKREQKSTRNINIFILNFNRGIYNTCSLYETIINYLVMQEVYCNQLLQSDANRFHLQSKSRPEEQGWRSGESTCLPPMCPGIDPGIQGHDYVG